jgi:hypothetical protein
MKTKELGLFSSSDSAPRGMFHLVIFFSTMRRLGETEIIYV